jgi:hypothetical protein
VHLPPQEPKLVLHSYVAVGDTFKIALGKTLPQVAVAPPEETYVTNGWVVLYENDIFVDSLKYKAAEKRYVSSRIVANAGKLYKVRAGAAGYPDIEAFTIAPSAVNITSVTRIKNARKTAVGSSLDDLKVIFTDPPGANFYLASIEILNGLNCVFTYDPAVERYAVDLVPFESSSCIDDDRIMYTDRSFNGMVKELTLSMYSNSLDSFVDASGKIYRPYIKKYNITEEYYRYLKTSVYQDRIFEEGSILTEPRTPRGNVRGGYGLFTVFAVVTDTIR